MVTPIAALAVEGLTVAFNGPPVVRDVSFAVQPGERVALIGASGSGKSLTAASVAGSTPRSARVSGRVRVDGVDVLGVPVGRRPTGGRIALVSQDPSAALNPLVPVGAQLAMPLRARHGLRAVALSDALTARLAAVGIEDPERVLRSSPGELSGGQRQRICIAIALACRASVLVADEPTTALDLVTQAQVVDVLRRTTGDTGLLFITHDIAVASSLCHRAVVLAGGEVVEEGTPAQLFAEPRHPHTRSLVESARRTALLRPARPARAPA